MFAAGKRIETNLPGLKEKQIPDTLSLDSDCLTANI